MLGFGYPLCLASEYTLKIYTEVQMDDPFILFAGTVATILFLLGFGYTIKEFRELEDERITNTFPEKSNAEIKK